jgi:hypothetical protein
MREHRAMRVGAAFGLAVLLLAGCSSGGSETPDEITTTKADAVVTTVAGKATTSTTTAAKATTTTAAKASTTTDPSVDPVTGLKPGEPCSLDEGVPDCIDPDGDGEGVYLIAGNDCMASAPDPALCEDLDGDGYAGYPDST